LYDIISIAKYHELQKELDEKETALEAEDAALRETLQEILVV